MSINYIPNDPSAVSSIPMRTVSPRPDRSSSTTHYNVADAVGEGAFDLGTPEFLYWQCREAALAAMEAWETIHGPFSAWQAGKVLHVIPNEGEDLNAYYTRKFGSEPMRISFFHQSVGSKDFFSGASTDVVAHEAGHAFLDAIRPDFWSSSRFEVNAYHEAFGDCIAIVTALNDRPSRQAVLTSLTSKNAIESTAENLAAGIKLLIPDHNAGVPRRARNSFEWGPSGSIPEDGGPGELIYEEHSFGQVFSGCFYDTIVNIFSGMSSQSEANLLKATQIAGKLLVEATKQAPQGSQFFREVGRFMILIDEQENNADHRAAIRDAFERHNIALGSSITLAPQAAFAAAPASRRAAKGMVAMAAKSLGGTAKKNLLELIGATSEKLTVTAKTFVGKKLHEAVHERVVALDDIHAKLKGVIATAAQVAVIGQSHQALSVLGAVSDPDRTDRDVRAFVASLVQHARIKFDDSKKKGAVKKKTSTAAGTTHEIKEVKGQKMLVRIRFACGK